MEQWLLHDFIMECGFSTDLCWPGRNVIQGHPMISCRKHLIFMVFTGWLASFHLIFMVFTGWLACFQLWNSHAIWEAHSHAENVSFQAETLPSWNLLYYIPIFSCLSVHILQSYHWIPGILNMEYLLTGNSTLVKYLINSTLAIWHACVGHIIIYVQH